MDLIKKLAIAISSLIVAGALWFLAKFIVVNFVTGFAFRNPDTTRVTLATLSGFAHVGLWIILLILTRKIYLRLRS